ncbi:MAG TPA: hypothetical protein VGJ78_19660 [Vicinamibacterales bacterium]|jgi:hypothetical protein
MAVALEPQVIRLQLGLTDPAAVTLAFEGASPQASLVGEDRGPTIYNFFSGNDRSAWRTNVPGFRSVLYRQVYDGVNIRLHDQKEMLEYDLLLQPGADLRGVVVRVDGASSLEVDPDGGLLVRTAGGVLRQTRPATFETRPDGATHPVTSTFRIIDAQRYGFNVPERDASLPLVIDPGIVWSTLTGGTGGEQLAGLEAARDGSGDLFISGTTYSPDFGATPTPGQTARYKSFVARLNALGDRYDFVTFINGLQNQTYAGGMAADAGGGVTLVGTTVDLDFPVTPGAFQTALASVHTGQSEGDGFVMRLNATGGLVFSTYLGGSGNDGAGDVVIDSAGQIIVTGTTNSTDFPTTVGAYDRTFNTPPAGDNTAYPLDAFIARLSANGTQLTYGTYYGGQTYETILDSVIDPQGFLTIVGVTTSSATGRDIPLTADAFDSTWNGSEDGYVARFKLDGAGTADLKYATFLGGVNQDVIEGVAIDPTNPQLVTVAGWAWYDSFTGPFFPTTAGVFKPRLTPQPPPTQLFPHNKTGFVARFRFPAAGPASLVWSTFVGGNWEDFLSDVAVDETGAAIVVGGTRSHDLQTTRGAVDRTQDGVASDAHDCFVWKLSPNADQLLYSSYLGGTYEDCEAALTIGPKVAYLGNNTIALAGMAGSGDFETTAGAVLRATDEVSDGVNPFVAKLTLAADASGDLTVSAPTLLGPVNGSTTGGSGGAVRFRWSDVTDPSGIEGYVHQISNRSDFAPGFTQEISTNSTELILDSIAINTPWFWRVRAADRAGNLSDWSPASTFTAGVSGATPVINFVQTYPTTVTGGGSAQGVLHLSDPAPPGGLQAILSTKDPRGYLKTVPPVTVPTTVSIPAGAISANFSIATTPVNESTPAAIYATTNAVGAKGSITVGIPSGPRAGSLMIDPFAVSSGHPATGTVTLTGPATAGGVVVPLRSSHPQYASVPASVTVPAGATSATFPIATAPVPFSIDVMIEATGGEFAARRLALKAGGGPRLTSFTLSTANASGGAIVTGTVTFSGPIPPSPFPATGDAIVTVKSTNPAVGMSPLVAVPVGSSSATFSILVHNVPATTTLSVVAAYDDAVLSAPLTISGTAASLASMTVNVNTLSGGQGGVGFVNLTAAAPPGHVLVDLSTNNPAITLPPNVTISEGTTSGLFAFNAAPVDAVTPVTISATYGPSRVTASVTVNPSVNVWVTSLALSPSTVTAGTSSTGTVTLNAPAPSGGATVQLSSMSPATVPPTVTVPGGATTATFTVGTTSVSATTQAKLWAVLNTTWGAVLTVTPGAAGAPSLSTLSLSPTTVTGGTSSQGTVTLSGPAPSGGSVVTLSSSNTAVATVPASVTVAAGSTSQTFTVTTATVSAATSATITGTLGVSRSATLTVNPAATTPAAPTLLAPANGATVTLPVTLDWNDVAGAASYQIQVDDSSAFTVPLVIDQVVTASQFTLSAAAASQHWWRVRGRNSAGTAGAWSPVRTFTVGGGGTPPPPTTPRTLTVTASGRSGERVTSSPAGISVAVGSTGSATFGSGTSITLSVSNGRDAIWSGACSSGGNKTKTCTFTINADATVTANVQ